MAEQPSTDRRALRREAKIAEIADQAWALSRAQGLAGISLRDLADRVGLRQPSLYAYFDSKLALYDAMFADGNRQLLAFTSDLARTGDPDRDLAELVVRIVQFSSEDVERHQLLFQRTIPGLAISGVLCGRCRVPQARYGPAAGGRGHPLRGPRPVHRVVLRTGPSAGGQRSRRRPLGHPGRPVVAMFLTEVRRTCKEQP